MKHKRFRRGVLLVSAVCVLLTVLYTGVRAGKDLQAESKRLNLTLETAVWEQEVLQQEDKILHVDMFVIALLLILAALSVCIILAKRSKAEAKRKKAINQNLQKAVFEQKAVNE